MKYEIIIQGHEDDNPGYKFVTEASDTEMALIKILMELKQIPQEGPKITNSKKGE